MHDTSPPPNPFESPRAVDPPPERTQKWQPTWSQCINGYLGISFVTGIVFAAPSLSVEDDYVEPLAIMLTMGACFASMLVPISILRACSVLRPLTLFLIWPLILIVFLSIGHALGPGRNHETYVYAIIFAVMFAIPLVIFAFYLAYLRRASN